MTSENKYTEFREKGEEFEVWNIIYGEHVGYIRRNRVGRFMHWCFFPKNDCWFSNGCLKEISKFITSCYSKNKGEGE